MSVSSNITTIQQLFRSVLDSNILETDLDGLSSGYLSIPYEAYSARLAIEKLKAFGSIEEWSAFKDRHKAKHSSQLFVGLGWALAETATSICDLEHEFSSEELWRVGDGIGYYAGIFKRRESIRRQQLPREIIENELTRPYLQGLGRSIFYISFGDPQRCKQTIDLFTENQQGDLWRGVGIAVGYVGGSSLMNLESFVSYSNSFKSNFICGLHLAYFGRLKSGDDINEVGTYLNHLGLSPELKGIDDSSFSAWITNLETSLK